MAISPFGGFILLLSSIAGVVVGVVFSRIVAEFILIVFRINEHLGAIRDQGGCGRFPRRHGERSEAMPLALAKLWHGAMRLCTSQ